MWSFELQVINGHQFLNSNKFFFTKRRLLSINSKTTIELTLKEGNVRLYTFQIIMFVIIFVNIIFINKYIMNYFICEENYDKPNAAQRLKFSFH